MSTRALAVLAVVSAGACAIAGPAAAAPGDLDPSFGERGKVFIDGEYSVQSEANDLVVRPDGRLLAIGAGELMDGSYQPAVFGFRADGSLDPGFGSGGGAYSDRLAHFNAWSSGALQPDGRLVVVTCTSGDVDRPRLVLARFTEAGALDPSFGDGGVEITDVDVTYRQGYCYGPIDVALQADGRIVAAAHVPGNFLVARFMTDGSLDPSFADGGIERTTFPGRHPGGRASSIQVAPSGRILVAGVHGTAHHNKEPVVVAYTPAGELDRRFSGDGIARLPLRGNLDHDPALALDGSQPIVGGVVHNSQFTRFRLFAGRLKADGGPDRSFGGDGLVRLRERREFYVQYPGIHAVAASKGRVLAAGSNGADLFVARWTKRGRPDRSFSGNGSVATDLGGHTDTAEAIAITDDGILAAGVRLSIYERSDASVDLAIVRYLDEPGPHDADADGVRDPADRCPSVPGERGRDCPVWHARAQVYTTEEDISGYLESKEPRCARKRSVTLYERRGGPDLAVDRTRSDEGGSFEFELPEPGRYYARTTRAVVPLGGVCLATRSNLVEVQ